jgi:RND family efflux transporter MFP subunit
VPVQAAVLQPAVWRTHVQVSASLAARQSATLAAAAAGIVTSVLFQSGQEVTAGQVLVQLGDAPQEAQLTLDQARLAQAQRDQARTRKLMRIFGASQAALEQAEATVAEAQAQVSLDQANLAQLRITAPFAGTMGIRNIDAGDYLQAGAAAASITATGPLRVLFSLPQTDASFVAPGDPFTLTAPSGEGPGLAAAGVVAALSPGQDPATDARAIEGRITRNAAGLLPGMFGVVDIATGGPVPAFALPSAALNDSAVGPFVFVITKGLTLSTVYVTIYGDAGADTLVSAAGLAAGERVVALGGFKLMDGQSVTIEHE